MEYWNNIRSIVLKLNFYRNHPDLLQTYIDDVQQNRMLNHWRDGNPPNTYTCFDDLQMIYEDMPYYECQKIGIYRHPSAISSLSTFVNGLAASGEPLLAFDWSDDLAWSAAKFLESVHGCNVYPNQLHNDGDEHEYLERVATFRNQ